MEFISIGPYCDIAIMIDKHGLRKHSYPFDYIFSSLEMVKHAIKDRFAVFLDKQYYRNGNDENSMHHSFYSTYINTELLRKRHIKHNLPLIADNLANREIFLHHNLLADENTYAAFVRRCNRLLELLDNGNEIAFIYYNCYTLEYDDIVDFASAFIENKNVYVVGIFENDCEKKILFETANCKIYQNYEIPVVFNEIQARVIITP